jgi:hypothetical protein
MTPAQKIDLLKRRVENLEAALLLVKHACEDRTIKRASTLRTTIYGIVVFPLSFKLPEEI